MKKVSIAAIVLGLMLAASTAEAARRPDHKAAALKKAMLKRSAHKKIWHM